MSAGRNLASAAGAEDGAALVLWAVLTPAMLILFLLVIDVGNWYVHKRHLQMQADAAALAGGAHFGDCFSPDAATVTGANAAIANAATAYAGNAASTYNFQVGGGAPRVTTLFNRATFADGTPDTDPPEEKNPCQTAKLEFDVKQTEADVPYILGSIITALVPGGQTVVPAINARARVALKKATIMQGSLPLAVPDVDPKHVTATFVNEAAGTVVAGPFALTKGTAANGLNWWQGAAAVSVPADSKIGVRIGLGGLAGTCGPGSTGGTGYVCYDYSNTSIGLVAIQGAGTGGTLHAPKPRVWATSTCASSGGPFFGPEDIPSPGTTCAVSVQAVMDTGGATVLMPNVLLANAILNGGGLKNVSAPLTYDGGAGYWSTGYVFNVPAEGGAVDVSLEWRYLGGTKQGYSNIQRVYSGVEEDSGPVKAVALASATGTAGAPYALDAGTHSLMVTVGLEGSLDLSEIHKTVMLRLTGGSRTSAVECDTSGGDAFRDAIVYGCTTPYQLNTAGYCPDPAPPPGPATCVETKTGDTVGPTQQALNTRFAACPPNNWPDYDVASDPRVVKLMITDFSALGGSGHTTVPVTNFAAFYVTGWTGSTCANNDPPPFTVKKGGIWGHFIKYIAPDPFSDGTQACDPTAVTPCIVSLVK